MTYKDIIDTLVQRSGDTSTPFRANVIRWLNLVRQEAAIRGTFNVSEIQDDLTTSAGINEYTISDTDAVMGDTLVNETSDNTLRRVTEQDIRDVDPARDDSGEPTKWASFGVDSNGDHLIRLWPTPDAQYLLTWMGFKTMGDITASNETVRTDPYFGRLTQVAPMLMAGLNWQYAIFDEQDIAEVYRAEKRFDQLVSMTSAKTPIDNQAPARLEPVLRRGTRPAMGRFNSHFDNR